LAHAWQTQPVLGIILFNFCQFVGVVIRVFGPVVLLLADCASGLSH